MHVHGGAWTSLAPPNSQAPPKIPRGYQGASLGEEVQDEDVSGYVITDGRTALQGPTALIRLSGERNVLRE